MKTLGLLWLLLFSASFCSGPQTGKTTDEPAAPAWTVIVLSNREWVANNVADRVGELIGAGFSFEPSLLRPAPARRDGRRPTDEIFFAQSRDLGFRRIR